ncbi:MAG: c-type cytochrome [Alphaproteobacteria bacterium]|nr:c-type cytochrome [Alphaproteobacteria bacterium]
MTIQMRPPRGHHALLAVCGVSLLALTPSCLIGLEPDDAGDEAFVLQAIPTLLGRQPIGAAEVEILTTLAVTEGREAVADVLMAQPEFVTYWTQVLATDLLVDRFHATDWQQPCYGDPLLSDSLADELVDHIANDDPLTPLCFPSIPSGGGTQLRILDQSEVDVLADAAVQSGYTTDTAYAAGIPTHDNSGYPYSPTHPTYQLGAPTQETSQEGLFWDNMGAEHGADEQWYGSYPAWGFGLGTVSGEVSYNLGNCMHFNMTDVIRSSILMDRMDPIYRGYLAPMQAWPDDGMDVAENLGNTFLGAYVDRNPTCMGCHTSTYSRTDARPRNGNWDRFYPVLFWSATDSNGDPVSGTIDLEGSAFSYDCAPGDPSCCYGLWEDCAQDPPPWRYGGDGGTPVWGHVRGVFRPDIMMSGNPKQNPEADPAGMAPWGFIKECVSNDRARWDGFHVGVPADANRWAAVGEVGPADDASVLDLIREFKLGMDTLDQMTFEEPDWSWLRDLGDAQQGQADLPTCLGCHNGAGQAPPLEEVVPTLTDARLWDILKHGSGAMPNLYLNDQRALNLIAYFRDDDLSGFANRGPRQSADRNHAMLTLLAMNITNNVIEEVLGERVTLDHGHPRNYDQWFVLWGHMGTFMESGWSLQELLRSIVLSDAFGRPAPSRSSQPAYDMPIFAFPWAATAPGETPIPGSDANSVGDYVHRYSIEHLLHAVHHALGWPEPRILGMGNPDEGQDLLRVYPNRHVMRDIGRYHTDSIPGSKEVQLNHLLTWEAEIASCEKPDHVVPDEVRLATTVTGDYTESGDDWIDWIDLLVEASDQTRTLEEVVLAVKDRLHTDPSLTTDERALVSDLFGGADLAATTFDAADEPEVRAFCGVLLKSPQFMMGGFASPEVLPASPPDPIACLESECDPAVLCARYEQDAAEILGYPVDLDCL